MIHSLFNNDIKATIISSEGYDNDMIRSYSCKQTKKQSFTQNKQTKNKSKNEYATMQDSGPKQSWYLLHLFPTINTCNYIYYIKVTSKLLLKYGYQFHFDFTGSSACLFLIWWSVDMSAGIQILNLTIMKTKWTIQVFKSNFICKWNIKTNGTAYYCGSKHLILLRINKFDNFNLRNTSV